MMELSPGGGGGLCCGTHAVPVQISAAVPLASDPIASQNRVETQDTEFRTMFATLGVADHACPFQWSTSAIPPTATQNFTDTHDTEMSGESPGIGSLFHDVPFHISAPAPGTCPIPGLAELSPTASQNLAETHETESSVWRTPKNARAGFGLGLIVQELPFHASVSAVSFPATSKVEPTAAQKPVETQETALRMFSVASAGASARCTRHECPFQRAANVRGRTVPGLAIWPAASQVLAATHDTPLSLVPGGTPMPAGTGCDRHDLPCHATAATPLLDWPTASQNFAEAQETPVRSMNVAPAGLGTAWPRHDVPFHRAAPKPTASQNVADAHETTSSNPVDRGSACERHDVPFHRSAKTASVSEL